MKHIVLYGVNPITEKLLKQYPGALLASTKGNEQLNNQVALSLPNLIELLPNQIEKIIICSIFVDEIASNLLAKGIPAKQIFFYNIATEQIVNVLTCQHQAVNDDDILYAIYDLAKNVLCYDALSFAAACEVERIKQQKKYLYFVIAPKNTRKGQIFYQTNYPQSECEWRLQHIVKPLFNSFDSCLGITELPFREDVSHFTAGRTVFPLHFDTDAFNRSVGLQYLIKQIEGGYQIPTLKIEPQASRLMEQFLASHQLCTRQLLTFTFRGSSTHSVRNTNAAPWLEFIRNLDPHRYLAVIIRDTAEACSQPYEETSAVECPLASISLPLRLALYQKALINFGVATGPCFSYFFIAQCSSILFTPCNEANFASSRSNIERTGYRIGEPQPFQNNGTHQIIFEQETPELIEAAFQQQLQLLKEQGYV